MIPQDPVMLLSFVNMKLRDGYANFDALCEGIDEDKEEIEKKLNSIGYHYDPAQNAFK